MKKMIQVASKLEYRGPRIRTKIPPFDVGTTLWDKVSKFIETIKNAKLGKGINPHSLKTQIIHATKAFLGALTQFTPYQKLDGDFPRALSSLIWVGLLTCGLRTSTWKDLSNSVSRKKTRPTDQKSWQNEVSAKICKGVVIRLRRGKYPSSPKIVN